MASNNSGIPAINSLFVNENGALTQAWFNYLLQLSPQQAGAAAQVQDLTGGSPFLFTAPVAGSLVITSTATMTVSISRDNGLNFYQIGVSAMAVALRRLDQVQITWIVPAPDVAWLPDL